LNKKTSTYVASIGLLLSGFALLASVLSGFGGFSIQAISFYIITGYVSRIQIFFIILTGLGLLISAEGYVDQPKKLESKIPNIIPILYLIVSSVFFISAIFGLNSKLKNTSFWGNTVFEEIQNSLIYNNLTLACFLSLGILQLIMSIIFSKTYIDEQTYKTKIAKILTISSGVLLIIKIIVDIPLLKESIFILSYMIKIPFPNNIISLVAPIFYLFAQIAIATILFQNQNLSTNQ